MSEVQLLSNTTLPSILPLDDAAQALGVDAETLLRMVQSGRIIAFRDPNGEVFIPMNDGQPLLPSVPAMNMNGNGKRHAEDTQEPEDINARLRQIKREDFAHLEGTPITVSEAAKKYGVSPNTIQTWKRRYPHALKVLRPGRGRRGAELNEADIAYLVAIYRVRKIYGTRAPLLNEDGTPYLIKYPDLARARRSGGAL